MLAYIHTICFFLYTSSIHTARKSEYKGNPPTSQEDNIKAAQNKKPKKEKSTCRVRKLTNNEQVYQIEKNRM